MKKKALFFMAFMLGVSFLLLAVSGCQSSDQRGGEIDKIPMERRIGVIKSLGGVKTSNQGTHLLQLDDGTTILLKSLAINLDDPQYVNMTVEVRGALLYTTDGKQIMEVMNIDVLEEAISELVAALNWKDYVSTELGFSIKYRNDLKVTSMKSGGIEFMREPVAAADVEGKSETETKFAGHEFMVDRTELAEGQDVLNYLRNMEEFKNTLTGDTSADLLAAGLARSKIGYSNYDAIKRTYAEGVIYYIQSGNLLYVIQINSGNDEKSLDDQNLFYEMLSTFRLLDKDEAASAEADVLNNLEIMEGGEKKTTKVETPSEETSVVSVTQEVTSGAKVDVTGDKVETSGTQEGSAETSVDDSTVVEVTGYSLLESETFKFGLQYPKSWYYAGSASTESGIVRHYDFGTKPIEEEPGIVGFDVMSGSMPSGTSVTVGSKTATRVTSEGNVEIYVKGEDNRYYRLSGPAAYESTLLQMASTIENK